MKTFLFLLSFLLTAASAVAQQAAPAAPDAADRAARCVAELHLTDAEAKAALTETVRTHLTRLAEGDRAYRARLKFANDSMPPNRRDHVVQNMGNKRKAELYEGHFGLRRELAAYLSAEQTDALLDALTLHRAPTATAALLARYPQLTEPQRRWVKAAYDEAREFALDTATDDEAARCFSEGTVRVEEQLMLWGYDVEENN